MKLCVCRLELSCEYSKFKNTYWASVARVVDAGKLIAVSIEQVITMTNRCTSSLTPGTNLREERERGRG